jgi:hypothetical protein
MPNTSLSVLNNFGIAKGEGRERTRRRDVGYWFLNGRASASQFIIIPEE